MKTTDDQTYLSIDTEVELELQKQRQKTYKVAVLFIVLFITIQIGRAFFGASPLLLAIVALVFISLSVRLLIVNRYSFISSFGAIFILLITTFVLAAGSLYVIFSLPILESIIDDSGSAASFLIVFMPVVLSVILGILIYYYSANKLTMWAENKLRQSIKKSISSKRK